MNGIKIGLDIAMSIMAGLTLLLLAVALCVGTARIVRQALRARDDPPGRREDDDGPRPVRRADP
jgi:hypothetical protein